MRRENERIDILSRKSYPKKELFRLVFLNHELLLEEDRPLQGRGVYLKKDRESVAAARKKKLLERRFRLDDCDHVYLEMEERL